MMTIAAEDRCLHFRSNTLFSKQRQTSTMASLWPASTNQANLTRRTWRSRGRYGTGIVRGQAQQMFRPIMNPVFMIGTAVDSDLVLADETFPETYLYLYIKTDEQLNETVSVRRFGEGRNCGSTKLNSMWRNCRWVRCLSSALMLSA